MNTYYSILYEYFCGNIIEFRFSNGKKQDQFLYVYLLIVKFRRTTNFRTLTRFTCLPTVGEYRTIYIFFKHNNPIRQSIKCFLSFPRDISHPTILFITPRVHTIHIIGELNTKIKIIKNKKKIINK